MIGKCFASEAACRYSDLDLECGGARAVVEESISTLQSARSELWLSPISVWELLLLTEKGRVKLDRPPERWIKEAFASSLLRDAPLNREVAIESRRLRLPHEDPADRFIQRRPGSTT